MAERLVDAIGRGDHKALRGLYDPEIAFYSPVAWGVRGVQPLVDFIDQFHAGFPGLEMTLHDEVVSADGRRVALRFSMAFSNTGSFFGNPPTGRSGVHIETHVLRLRDGRIVEQVVGDTNFGLPRLMLTDWRMPLPEDPPDPAPV